MILYAPLKGDIMITIQEYLKLEITRDCNLECVHCYRGEKENKYMSLETIDKSFKDVEYITCLMIAGGESFLAIEQLERIYEQIVKNNVNVEVMLIKTNCTIMNDRIVNVLANLSKTVGSLYVTTMADPFRRMEIIDKGLKKDADYVATFLEENNYLRVVNGNTPYRNIYKVGKAANLTEEDMIRANKEKTCSPEFKLVDESQFYDSRAKYNSPYATNNTIFRTIYVTVDGNLCNFTPHFHTYEQEDNMIEGNINDYDNILDAVNGTNMLVIEKMLKEEESSEYKTNLTNEYNKLKALIRKR